MEIHFATLIPTLLLTIVTVTGIGTLLCVCFPTFRKRMAGYVSRAFTPKESERAQTNPSRTPRASTKRKRLSIFGWLAIDVVIIAVLALWFSFEGAAALRFIPSILRNITHAPHHTHSATVQQGTNTDDTAEVNVIEARKGVLRAPLAEHDSDDDPWSSWTEVPVLGTHGFDLYLSPGTNSGAVRLQCGTGDTIETITEIPCSEPYTWFRVNTVQSETRTVPIETHYFFKHNS